MGTSNSTVALVPSIIGLATVVSAPSPLWRRLPSQHACHCGQRATEIVCWVSASMRQQFADRTGYKSLYPRRAARLVTIEFLLFATRENGVHRGAQRGTGHHRSSRGGIRLCKKG